MKSVKSIYRIRNWPEYNKSLMQRASITFWITPEAIEQWFYNDTHKQGSPKKYSDYSIQVALTLRSLFSLPLRQTQGFLESFKEVMDINICIPNYTTICRRQKNLSLSLPKRCPSQEPINIVIDSTGLKVFGEGEWKVRRHGYSKHRMWRKLHIVIDSSNGEILSHHLSTNSVTDSSCANDLLASIPNTIQTLTGDSAYDKFNVYNYCFSHSIKPIIQPQANARIRNTQKDLSLWRDRNDTVNLIRKKGLDYWKKHSRYSLRSLVETTMFRYKTAFSDKPLAHQLENQRTEVAIKCFILNMFLRIAKPISYPVMVNAN